MTIERRPNEQDHDALSNVLPYQHHSHQDSGSGSGNYEPPPQTGWTRYASNPILQKGGAGQWDDEGVAAKSIVKSGDTWYMYYQGDGGASAVKIGLATSTDLIHWTKHPANPILDVGAGGSWESSWVGMPNVIKEGDVWHMFYEGSDGVNSKIGHATSADGITWVKDVGNPVLSIGAAGQWDDTYTGTPSLFKIGAMWFLYYVAARFPPTDETGIAFAYSLDGPWEKCWKNPILQLGAAATWNDSKHSGTFIMSHGNNFLLFTSGYDGADWAIGYSISYNGLDFVECDDNPILQKNGAGWESTDVQLPIVVRSGDTYYMFYSGNDGTNFSVGFATKEVSLL